MHLLAAFRGTQWDTVLVHRWGGPLRDEMDRAATRSYLEPLSKARVLLWRQPRTKALANRIADLSIRAVLRRERPDVVLCNSVMATRYAVAASMGIPVVVYSHESEELVSTVLGRVDTSGWSTDPNLTFVGCATDTSRAFATVLGVEPERVHTLHSPVDVHALRSAAERATAPPVDGPFVLGCGVGDHRKGIDVFNAAAEAARAAGRDETWVWVGKVPSETRSDAVTYPGEQPSATPWLAAASVVALTSRADPFPLVVLEAMAVGTPVVATDLPGPREQLGDAGSFVPVDDADALVAAVSALLDDPEAAAEQADRAAERVLARWDTSVFAAGAVELVELAATRA